MVTNISNTPPTPLDPEVERFKDAEAQRLGMCREAVKLKANYSSKADFGWGYVDSGTTKLSFMKGEVDLMNGFGAMIPYTYICKFENGLLVETVLGKN